MKLKKLEELEDGMWCRLASGEVYTFDGLKGTPGFGHYSFDCGYHQALIEMGAEWYPKIPEGYRLATEEDRKGPKSELVMFCSWASDWEWEIARSNWWEDDCEYIVPVKQEPKVYTVVKLKGMDEMLMGNTAVFCDYDFQPGDRVEVRKVGA